MRINIELGKLMKFIEQLGYRKVTLCQNCKYFTGSGSWCENDVIADEDWFCKDGMPK